MPGEDQNLEGQEPIEPTEPLVSDVEPEPEPDIPPEWEGRIKKEQGRLTTARSQIEQQSNGQFTLDNEGNVIQNESTPGTYSQPAPTGEEEKPDAYEIAGDPEKLMAYIDDQATKKATQIASNMLGQIVPTIDKSFEGSLKATYPDWDDIKGDVQSKLRGFGITTLTQAASYPQYFNMAIESARYSKMVKKQSPVNVTESEAERAARVAQTAAGGGGAAKIPPALNELGLTAEEVQEYKDVGLSDGDIANVVGGKATIDVIGGGK